MDSMKNFLLIPLFLLGVVLFVLNRKIESYSASKNVSQNVRNANTGVLVIGVALIVIPLSVLNCQISCKGSVESLVKSDLVYGGLLSALGICLIVLGSIIQSSEPDVAKEAGGIWGSGIGVFMLSLLFLWNWWSESKKL